MGTGMVHDHGTQAIAVSVILPANNEAALIGGCLQALLASDVVHAGSVQVIVAANGCHDKTADIARGFGDAFGARDWRLDVLDLAQGGKLAALNAADAEALGSIRIYLDADVTVTPALLPQIVLALSGEGARYASGQVQIAAEGWTSRAYARLWRKVPFMADVVPGCGVFAVNTAGRARWDRWPDIIADDVFARLQFDASERIGVAARYRWPIAEGFGALVKVRRRQNAGVDQVAALYPDLMDNEDKPAFPLRRKLGLALGDPLGFIVYSSVALAVKLTRGRASGWSRGR